MKPTRRREPLGLPFSWMAMFLIALAAFPCTGRLPAAEPELTQADRARLKEAEELNTKQFELYDQGKARDAIPLAKQVLAIRKEVLGEKHPNTATSRNNLALLLQVTGDYAGAKPLYEQALAINKEVLGEKHPSTAKSLNNLAYLLRSTGDYAGAKPLYDLALAINKEVLGAKHPDTATSLNNLAELLREMGDYAGARPLYEQALAIKMEVLGEKHPNTATSRNNLALLLQVTGDYAGAKPLYEQALAINKEVLGEKHPNTATSLNNLAGVLKSTGDYAGARPLLEQALAIRKEVLGEKHPDTAVSLNGLASLLESTGDYAEAKPLYEQALAIRKEVLGEKHPDTATSLNNLAGLLSSTGDYAGAKPLYDLALAINKEVLGEKHPDTATSLDNLAGLLKSTKNYAGARQIYEQALAIKMEALGEKHPDTATSLNNLAELLREMGDYAGARTLYEQALAINKEALGEKHPDTATSLNNLGGLLESTADYARARPLFEQALAIRKEVLGENHPDTAVSLSNLGTLSVYTGNLEQSEPLLGQAAQIALDNLDTTAVTQSERQQLAMNESVRFLLDWYLNLAVRRVKAVPRAYELVLAWKGAIFVRQHQMHLAANRPELAPFFAEWQAVSNRLATRMLAAPAPDVAAAWRAEIVALTDRQEHLESEMARRSAEFRQLQTKSTPALVRESLPPSAALLDLLEYDHWTPPPKDKPGQGTWERQLLAFVVRADHEPKMISLGLVETLKQAIGAWRLAMDRGEDVTSAGDRLHRLLWKPLAAELDGAKTVLISPDGVVGQFPWAALPGSKPGKYLMEELPVAIVPVPQMLPWMTRENSAGEDESLLVVGEVDYGASSGVPLDDSRAAVGMDRDGRRMVFADIANNTRREMTSIYDSFAARFGAGAVKQLRKDGATEAAFRAEAGQRRWLHVATHGYFAPVELTQDLQRRANSLRQGTSGNNVAAEINPGLLSGLALTGANNPLIPGHDDGILTAVEVASLDLSHVRMTVLSACETGLGRVAGGEGLLGLQRAFQVSGAQTTVASLWKVPDKETAVLMSRFYDNLWAKKMTRLAALREAQLWMLTLPQRTADRRELASRGFDLFVEEAAKSRKQPPADRRLPPKYWAAFVLSGDWR